MLNPLGLVAGAETAGPQALANDESAGVLVLFCTVHAAAAMFAR